jgi:hypothetical protein
VGTYDDVVSVDDPLLEGFSLDAKRMFVKDALEKKRQQQQTNAEAAAQAARAAANASDRWVDFIDQRIEEAVQAVGFEVGRIEKSLHREIQQTLRKRLEVVQFDPGAVMKASMNVRRELKALRRKSGEVVDLPQLPKRKEAS